VLASIWYNPDETIRASPACPVSNVVTKPTKIVLGAPTSIERGVPRSNMDFRFAEITDQCIHHFCFRMTT